MPKTADRVVQKRKAGVKAIAKPAKRQRAIPFVDPFGRLGGRVVKSAGKEKRRPTRGEPLPFYAVVKVKEGHAVPSKARGRRGVVVDRAETKTGNWKYSVALSGLEDSYYLPHSALIPTGRVAKRQDLYGLRSGRRVWEGDLSH